MSFSNSAGGTLALPSPTHAHHMDVTPGIRSLRRSLSRSPSKFLSRTSSQSSDISQQASPQSPSRRLGLTPQRPHLSPSQPQTAPPAVTSTNASTLLPSSSSFTPLRPNVKLSLRSTKSAKSSSSSRALARTRVSPKSPLKRALYAVPDAANVSYTPSPSPPALTPPGQENTDQQSPSPSRSKSSDRPARHSVHIDVSGTASQYSFLKTLATDEPHMVPTTGALKRSDATMNLDYPSQGSPVAKRRSVHGFSTLGQSADVNIFGNTTTVSQSFDIHEDSLSEYELAGSSDASDDVDAQSRDPSGSPTPASGVPKRSSSLRKSTLQQRHGDKGSWGKKTGERQLAQLCTEASTSARNRPRLSTEHFTPLQAPRESPFTSAPPLPNPAMQNADGRSHQPHPLSKSLTTSTSGNSLTEETPNREPAVQVLERPKPHPFSRSLPLNATRPTARPASEHNKVVATPSQPNQLWRGAFHSTGLISKVNRNPEEEDSKFAPPDTPCKKHANPFATFPPLAGAGSAVKRKSSNRNSFAGIPSTPFGRPGSRGADAFGQPGKGLSIFQRGSAAKNSRRGSILSLEGEDAMFFDDVNELPESLDEDVPSTPTKNGSSPSLGNLDEQSLESPSTNRTFMLPLSAVKPASSRESSSSPVAGRRTPQTPQESLLPLDTSRLSISQASDKHQETNMPLPVTPTAGRDFKSSGNIFVTPVNGRMGSVDVDASLYSRFDKVELVGRGVFSTVYRVTKMEHAKAFSFSVGKATPRDDAGRSPAKGRVYAVKKSKQPYHGHRDREIKLREVRALKALAHAEHVVQYVDSWEHNFHLYIQTEFCEEGTLAKFLANIGCGGRLDDFRIFKILQDLCLGLKEIHDAGFMHLDIKPANILINFEGALKIGDFGLALPCGSPEGVDVEGDREYMAPEMLRGKAGKAADVFSLGLITLEMAANMSLPENGPTWVALRSGDLSEVPSLTWNPSVEVQRDDTGNRCGHDGNGTRDGGGVFGPFKRSELRQPPDFMVDSAHPSSLDSIVRWMTAEDPVERLLVDQVLELEGLRWVAEYRNAPATVYEGGWGPTELLPVSIASLDGDTEMTGV